MGTATKVGSAGTTTNFDSGILARAIELGIPGGLLFAAALALAFWTSLSAWHSIRGSPQLVQIATITIALQVAIVGMELAGDAHVGLQAILMWAFVGTTGRMLGAAQRKNVVSSYLRIA